MTTYYTSEHEWISVDGDVGTVGITKFAAEKLGDVVFVELPDAGKKVKKEGDMAVVESSQGQGIGARLMDKASEILGPGCTITLLALPGAEGFYQKIGLTQTSAAFYRDRTHRT